MHWLQEITFFVWYLLGKIFIKNFHLKLLPIENYFGNIPDKLWSNPSKISLFISNYLKINSTYPNFRCWKADNEQKKINPVGPASTEKNKTKNQLNNWKIIPENGSYRGEVRSNFLCLFLLLLIIKIMTYFFSFSTWHSHCSTNNRYINESTNIWRKKSIFK